MSMNYLKAFTGSLLLSGLLAACNNSSDNKQEAAQPAETDTTVTLKEQTVTVNSDGASLSCYVVYNDAVKGKRPAVLVLPEWWGITDYPRMRARMLAQLGYVGMAVDMYGDGKVADSPALAQTYAMPFYQHPEKGKTRVDSCIAKIRSFDVVD